MRRFDPLWLARAGRIRASPMSTQFRSPGQREGPRDAVGNASPALEPPRPRGLF